MVKCVAPKEESAWYDDRISNKHDTWLGWRKYIRNLTNEVEGGRRPIILRTLTACICMYAWNAVVFLASLTKGPTMYIPSINKIKFSISVAREIKWVKDCVVISATRNMILISNIFLCFQNDFSNFFLECTRGLHIFVLWEKNWKFIRHGKWQMKDTWHGMANHALNLRHYTTSWTTTKRSQFFLYNLELFQCFYQIPNKLFTHC